MAQIIKGSKFHTIEIRNKDQEHLIEWCFQNQKMIDFISKTTIGTYIIIIRDKTRRISNLEDHESLVSYLKAKDINEKLGSLKLNN